MQTTNTIHLEWKPGKSIGDAVIFGSYTDDSVSSGHSHKSILSRVKGVQERVDVNGDRTHWPLRCSTRNFKGRIKYGSQVIAIGLFDTTTKNTLYWPGTSNLTSIECI